MFETPSRNIFKGAILTVSMRWADRLVGFTSTLILARLMAPDNFGIIAMATLVAGLVEVMLALGVNVPLIQNRAATQAHFDTAWTLRLLQSAFVAAAVFLSASYAGGYFNDPRITPVLYWMALNMLLGGLENIGIITFQKEMRFDMDFKFVFIKRLAAFFITVTAAWFIRNYWALVIGTLAGRSIGVLLSYQMHPMRPRLSLEKFRDIFSVSQWMLANNIGAYLNRGIDKFLLGRWSGANIIGGYALADETARMPSTEILAPLNRVLFPAFVAARHDPAEMKRLYLLAQGVQCLLGMSMAVGLALVAHETVLILLGEQWLFVVPIVQVLALANVVEAVTASGNYVFLTLDAVRNASLLSWYQVLMFGTLAFLFFHQPAALEMAWLRLATALACMLLSLGLLLRLLQNVSLLDILGTTLRPFLGVCIMAAAVTFVAELLHLPPLAMLVTKIATGMLVFPAAVLAMWNMAGRPEGAESYLLAKVARLPVKRTTGFAA
ncbi:lipopolysaccharide biosynthesis protein [Noviherbaspirillum massiliense]|uniref:lipopolysaccharide biosynthesis protein n=1 Tax=Noviherbaspirillum massiliense TaxID=1465823 RepID=UPI00030644AB|nr:lipopolysaccharide biosynthesis protein [Noviherbaspirillum massiliense]